jgi:hypothetical protein
MFRPFATSLGAAVSSTGTLIFNVYDMEWSRQDPERVERSGASLSCTMERRTRRGALAGLSASVGPRRQPPARIGH